jgi:hypothetical protein
MQFELHFFVKQGKALAFKVVLHQYYAVEILNFPENVFTSDKIRFGLDE